MISSLKACSATSTSQQLPFLRQRIRNCTTIYNTVQTDMGVEGSTDATQSEHKSTVCELCVTKVRRKIFIHPVSIAAAALTEPHQPYLPPTTTNATSRQRTIPRRVLIRSAMECFGYVFIGSYYNMRYLLLEAHRLTSHYTPQFMDTPWSGSCLSISSDYKYWR